MTTSTSPTSGEQSRFEKETEGHVMTVEQDEGVFRCLYFGKPGTSVYHFRLTTWPGHLCVSGDMGTFVFSRLHDMFEFFRGDGINPQYWGQKLQAIEKGNGFKEFSSNALVETINDIIRDRMEDDEPSEEWLIEAEFLRDCDYANTFEAVNAFMESNLGISDFYEYADCMEVYTHHYIWCLHAIVWGIQKYDSWKVSA